MLNPIKNSEKGVSLFLTVIVMTIILAVVFGISSILVSGIKIIRETGYSVVAFYAADSGIEKTYYFDKKIIPEGGKRGLCDICTPGVCPDCQTCQKSLPEGSTLPEDCDPMSCTNCQISFFTNFDGKKYEIEAVTEPIEVPPETDYVDPNDDGATLEWNSIPAGKHFLTINDKIRQPKELDGGSSDYIYTRNSGSSDYFDMGTLRGVDSVTEVKIWIYGKKGRGGKDAGADIYMGGWQGGWHGFGLKVTSQWKNVTFSGFWTKTDLDNLIVKLTRATGGMRNTYIYAMYAEITYLPESPTKTTIKSSGSYKGTKRAIELIYRAY